MSERGRPTISSEEGDGSASAASTTSTANAMHVVLRVVGVIIVENVSDVLDVFQRAHDVSKELRVVGEREQAIAILCWMRDLSGAQIRNTRGNLVA